MCMNVYNIDYFHAWKGGQALTRSVITNSTPHRTFVLVLSIIVSSLFYEIQINPAIASSLLSFISTEALGPFRCGFMA